VRFSEGSFFDPLPDCDAVMASLSLHHIPSAEGKGEVYRRVAEALAPGGVFVNADVTMPEGGDARDRAWRGWADHLVASGITEDDAWRHFDEWSDQDTYFPLELELRLMREAGLDARRVWSLGVATVLVGKKIVSGGGASAL
jgi:tRNA (cmo5U34)-methyltransferase